MGTISYVCWTICLVQIVGVAHGRPDFGTSFQFTRSAKIGVLAGELSDHFAAVDDELHFMLSGLLSNSQSQLGLLVEFAESFSVLAKTFTEALADSVSGTSDSASLFNQTLSAYEELVSFLNDNRDSFVSATASQLSRYVSYEFWDVLGFAFEPFNNLKMAVQRLQEALEDASTERDVPSTPLENLERALRQAKAHLPILDYVFQRVGINMHMADSFYALFNQDVHTFQTSIMGAAGAYANEMNAMQAAVSRNFAHVKEMFNNVGEQIQHELRGPIERHPNFRQLRTSLISFADSRIAFLEELEQTNGQAALNYQTELEDTLANEYYHHRNLYTPAQELATLLIESNVFAELCYNKFLALVADIPVLGLVRLNECFDTELPRLRKLQRLLLTYSSMLGYDVEDLLKNLVPCKNQHASNSCLTQITGYYTTLASSRSATTDGITGFVNSEINSSLSRLTNCLAVTDFYTFGKLVPVLIEDIQNCFEGYGQTTDL